MADTFESLDEFRDVMQKVMAMRRESLYRLVQGQPDAARDWEEIKAMVAEAGFQVSWLSRELEQITDVDHPPQPSNRDGDARYHRAQENWRDNRQIAWKISDNPAPRADGRRPGGL